MNLFMPTTVNRLGNFFKGGSAMPVCHRCTVLVLQDCGHRSEGIVVFEKVDRLTQRSANGLGED
jgi:hypothetical protein